MRRYADNFKVVVVVGPRQVGKTTMLRHLMEEDASRGVPRSYVTLDNTVILQTARQDPALFLQRWHPPVLIDEIQKAPELLPYIKEVVDTSSQLGSVWLTGSQPLHSPGCGPDRFGTWISEKGGSHDHYLRKNRVSISGK